MKQEEELRWSGKSRGSIGGGQGGVSRGGVLSGERTSWEKGNTGRVRRRMRLDAGMVNGMSLEVSGVLSGGRVL